MFRQLSAFTALVAVARAQQACTLTQETHPSMSWQKCAAGGSCSNVAGSVTIDANWRWTHAVASSTNCYTGNTWNSALCPNNAACAANCCVDGANYQATYGAATSGNSLSLKYVTKTPDGGTNVGSRLYLMKDENNYEMFKLLGNEFTFDVDVSQLGCGLNGALYFVSMDQDGGRAKYASNKAGAKYGTGYCDSQCPRDVKFIDGQANVAGWGGSDANSGTGNLGTCCAEMDIWEANSISTAYTPHPCSNNDQHSCTGTACGGTHSPDDRYGGTCDPDGCDFNSYRQGVKNFYGPGMTVDTKQKMTVVTQFIKNAAGKLGEIKRFYVQNGKVIPNSQSTIPGVSGNSITEAYCDAQKTVFGDYDQFGKRGDLAGMGDALDKGMVLVMSLWDDGFANMLWLDSTYPTTSTGLGAARGTCPTTGSKPDDLRVKVPNSSVVFSNIKFGPINSTFNNDNTQNPPTSTTTSRGTTQVPTSTPGPNPGTGTQQRWQQCGGRDYKGPVGCASPWTCSVVNEWYHQCL